MGIWVVGNGIGVVDDVLIYVGELLFGVVGEVGGIWFGKYLFDCVGYVYV